MKTTLLLLCLLLLTGQDLSAAKWRTRTHSRQHYARQQRKAHMQRHVAPHKVQHACAR